MKNNNIKNLVVSYSALTLICFYPIAFLFFQNLKNEVNLTDIFLPSLIFIVVGVTISLLLTVFIKSHSKTVLICIVLMFIMINFTYIEKLLKIVFVHIKYWHTLPLILVLYGHILCLTYKKLNTIICVNICKIISLALGSLLIFNFITTAPTLFRRIGIQLSKPKETIINSFESSYPNVYYILLDEYSSFKNIQKYYYYNNEGFINFLQMNNFAILYDSYNDSYDSITVTTNNLNLDYIVTDKTIRAEKLSYTDNPRLFTLFSEYGYSINNLSLYATWNNGTNNLKGSVVANDKKFFNMILENTAYYPFLKSTDQIESRQMVLDNFDDLQTTYEDSEYPVFTYAHIVCPHAPFVFTQNGDVTNFAAFNDWKDKSFYLEQYIYMTKLLQDTVENILKNDPDSIILLQSDHSARWTMDENGNEIVTNEDKRSIMNTVYYRGQSMELIDNLSAVNTLRVICSELFSVELPILEVPAYG